MRLLPILFFATTAFALQRPVPYLVRDLTPERIDRPSGVFFSAHTLGEIFYFGTDVPAAGLWRTDGSSLGTFRVADDAPGRRIYQWQPLLDWKGTLLYPVNTSTGSFLYRTDGSTAGTQRIAQVAFPVREMAPCPGDKVCFVADNHHVGVTDGTAAGTSILRSTAPGVPETNLRRYITAFKGNVYFNGYDDDAGRCIQYRGRHLMCGELWMSDGSAGGTRRFADLVPGPLPSSPTRLLASGDHLYFYLYEPARDYCRLWQSDGTVAGTRRFEPEVAADCAFAHPELVALRGHTYINSPVDGLLRTDGTTAGTRRLADFLGWTGVTGIRMFPAGDDVMLLVTRDGARELWRFDGENATRLGDAPAPQFMLGYLAKTGRLYHVYEKNPYELWSFDGKTHERVAEMRPPSASAGTPFAWGVTPNFLAFGFGGGSGARWVTDGTEAGTRSLDLTSSVSQDSYPQSFVAAQGKLFFRTSGPTPMRLWATDGTAAGTIALSEDGDRVVSRGGRVYFRVSSALWTTDGTQAGTRRVENELGASEWVDEPPAYLGSAAIFSHGGRLARSEGGTVTTLDETGHASGFETLGNAVLFWSYDPAAGASALRATDGTREGTRTLAAGLDVTEKRFIVDGNRAFFLASQKGANETWVYVTDGTTAGTKAVERIGSGRSIRGDMDLAWRGAAYFRFTGDNPPSVLWRSDGTAEGTYALPLRNVQSLAAIGNELILVGLTSGGTSEIWKSDGTPGGTAKALTADTHLVTAPFALPDGSAAVVTLSGAPSIYPGPLTIHNLSRGTETIIPADGLRVGLPVHSGGRLYFVGTRPQTGSELWAIPLDGVAPSNEGSKINIDYRGVARVNGARAAVFRVTMDAEGAVDPTVVATTVAGTLREGEHYTPFSRRIRFENDNPVTLVVPLHGGAAGTVSIVLSSPSDARIIDGFATAHVDVPRRRRAARQ